MFAGPVALGWKIPKALPSPQKPGGALDGRGSLVGSNAH